MEALDGGKRLINATRGNKSPWTDDLHELRDTVLWRSDLRNEFMKNPSPSNMRPFVTLWDTLATRRYSTYVPASTNLFALYI